MGVIFFPSGYFRWEAFKEIYDFVSSRWALSLGETFVALMSALSLFVSAKMFFLTRLQEKNNSDSRNHALRLKIEALEKEDKRSRLLVKPALEIEASSYMEDAVPSGCSYVFDVYLHNFGLGVAKVSDFKVFYKDVEVTVWDLSLKLLSDSGLWGELKMSGFRLQVLNTVDLLDRDFWIAPNNSKRLIGVRGVSTVVLTSLQQHEINIHIEKLSRIIGEDCIVKMNYCSVFEDDTRELVI